MHYTFVFILQCFSFTSSSWPYGHSSITIFMASRLAYVSFLVISMCITPSFLFYAVSYFLSSYWSSGHSYINFFVVSRLVSISCSILSLCISSRILFIQYSIKTRDEPSGHSYLTSHISIIAEYVILGSIDFLLLY